MSDKPTFRVGDSVVVNAGVMCPDKPSLSLAGWQGWVTEIDSESGTIGFNWDSVTLRAIPDDYIRESELGGLGWETMGLDIDEVSLATPRDTPQEAQAVYEEIMRHHAWDHLSDLNPGISQLLGPLGTADAMTILHAWEDHLEGTLRFPFKARREEAFERSPVSVGKIVEVLGIAEVDDHYGLLANVMLDRRTYMIPLCDLEATDEESPNYQPLNDYVVWFANR
jgi:hypothetical protein